MLATLNDAELISIDREASIPLLLKRHHAIIAQYANGFPWKIIPIEDRIQACKIGFMMAVREFDPTRGAKLTTFAVWKMRAELTKLKLDDYPWADGRDMPHEVNMLSIEYDADADMLLEPINIDAIEDVNQEQITKLFQDNIYGLKARELEIFYHLHGLFGYTEYTAQEVAAIFNISRQRVQQISQSVFSLLQCRVQKGNKAKDYLS